MSRRAIQIFNGKSRAEEAGPPFAKVIRNRAGSRFLEQLTQARSGLHGGALGREMADFVAADHFSRENLFEGLLSLWRINNRDLDAIHLLQHLFDPLPRRTRAAYWIGGSSSSIAAATGEP